MNSEVDLLLDRRPTRSIIIILCALVALWIMFAKFIVPPIIEGAYRGESLPVLNNLIEGQAIHPLEKYLGDWDQFATHLTVSFIGWALFALLLVKITGSSVFYRRFVGEATPGTLGAIRMLICTILLVANLMEDFPSIALLPPEMRLPKGVMKLFYILPFGFDSLVSSETGLRVFQFLTEVILFLGIIGWKTRLVVPLGALCHLVLWGILRDYTFFWHQTLDPLYVMMVLSFTPCGDGWSVDRLLKVYRGEPVPAADQGLPVYGWSRYACWLVIAALYVESGTNKLRIGGWHWWNANNLRNIFYTDSLSPREYNWTFGLDLAPAPDFVFAVLGLIVVVSQILMGLVLFSRTARVILPAAMAASHIGILLLQRILFLDLIVIQLVFYDFRKVRHAIARWLALRRGHIEILFDGQCPLCRRTVRVLGFFDLFARLRFIDFRRLDLADYNHGHKSKLTVEEMDNEMYIVSPGRIDRGFYGYRTIALALPALWPLVPVLYCPGVPTVGQLVYGYIARNRLRLVTCDASCEVPSDGTKPVAQAMNLKTGMSSRYALGISLMTFVLAFCWFYSIEFYPFTSTQLFSNQRTSVVSYYKVLAHRESGSISPAHLEEAIGVMKRNSRYESLIQDCAEHPENLARLETCNKFLTASAGAYNAKVSAGDRINAYEIQAWKWDFQTAPFDRNHGTVIASHVFDVRRSVPSSNIGAFDSSMAHGISAQTPRVTP